MRLRILYLIESASWNGGAERLALALAMNLPRDRFEPRMCSTREDEDLAVAMLREAGIPHVNLGRRSKWDVHRLAGLATLLRRERFDILHTHMFGSNVWGSLIGSACRVPVIVAHEHSWSYEGEPLRAWLDGRVVGRLATRFVAVSSADARRMEARERVPPAKIVIMPNAYVPSPQETDGDFRAELGISPQTPLIATAAILRPEKRVDLVLEAYARVVAAIPDAHLAIAGDGVCRPELEALARTLGLDSQVHFLGMRPDVDTVLRAADVAASGSDREGSPLLVFECMATDTPLVATSVGGLPEIVEHGRSGLLVPRRDSVAMADGLIGLLRDRARRAEMAGAARERLPEFTVQATVERFVDLYETLLQDARH